MNDLAIPQSSEGIDLAAIETGLRPLSTEKLRFRFFETYAGAARLMAEAAVCVKLMKERGENLGGVPMVGTFLRIASGQILPELVWKFIESPNRQRVERLPLDDQKRLATSPMVPVVETKPDGEYTTRMVDLTNAPPEVARLIAGPEGIRSPEEQLAVISAPKRPPVVNRPAPVPAPAEPLNRQVTVRMSESELEALRLRAARARVSEPEMLRRYLLQTEAFKMPRI